MTAQTLRPAGAAAGYLALIPLANWATAQHGFVPVGFGYAATAGTYFAGLAFTARDLVQDTWGRRPVVVCILLGALLSWWLAPSLALASGTAFLLSEGLDFAVYTPLRQRRWLTAVFASNVVGFAFDSVLFLWLAFGSLNGLDGQLVGKFWMTAIPVAGFWFWRNRDLPLRLRPS